MKILNTISTTHKDNSVPSTSEKGNNKASFKLRKLEIIGSKSMVRYLASLYMLIVLIVRPMLLIGAIATIYYFFGEKIFPLIESILKYAINSS